VPIDISMTKSKWFGESEKRIKNIFTKYHNRVKRANDSNLPVPILLLNEADAVINKRKDTSFNNVAQTENAIQNILLEELEKLDGILIATTNLTENIDTAFERRFIYKINFQKPCIETRQAIWKNFIPELTGKDTNKLSEAFDLSGAQIENIARKCTISGILNGNEPEFSDLIKFCNEETILNNDSKIGFK
jgi:SpoVK/Ycf46/Vps4 family AAA+-type ATPase